MKKLALFLSFLFVISCTKDPIIYTLTTSANPADGGTVSPSTQQYDEGKTATITATASYEYVFQSWSGAAELKERDMLLIREQTKPKSSEPHIHQQIY
ncbi:hypothetical protein N8867_02410 [Flavobacteriaceae bacterium]|nr:hypothetical protein [Flavobacteriaceae bacterium]